MLKLVLLTLGLLAAILCLPFVSRSPQAAAQEKNSARPALPETAKIIPLYRRDCALCHGDNGNGKTDLAAGMNLTLDDWTDPRALGGKPDSALFAIIRNGKDKMPAEETGRASDAEVRSLIAYIRSFAKPRQTTSGAAPAQGAPSS